MWQLKVYLVAAQCDADYSKMLRKGRDNRELGSARKDAWGL
jgi:hypothetical protein